MKTAQPIDCATCAHCSTWHCGQGHHGCQPGACPCEHSTGREHYEHQFAGCLQVGIGLHRQVTAAMAAAGRLEQAQQLVDECRREALETEIRDQQAKEITQP